MHTSPIDLIRSGPANEFAHNTCAVPSADLIYIEAANFFRGNLSHTFPKVHIGKDRR